MIPVILTYRYLIIFPLAILEGPILTVVAGFLVTTGALNFFLVYIIVVIGDIIGDAWLYFLGHSGQRIIRKYGKYIGVSQEKLEWAEGYFKTNHKRALIFSKVFHGIGMAGLVGAGALNVKYRKFFKTCLSVSLIQSAVLLVLGMFFGGMYLQIGKYLNYYAAGVSVVVVAVILFLIFRKYFNFKKYFYKNYDQAENS